MGVIDMLQKSELSSAHPSWWSQIQTPIRHLGERMAEFFSPSSEAATTEDAYEVSIELPGVGEKDIAVEVHGDQLTITGEKHSKREESGKNFYFSERTFGKFHRAFRLPADADADQVTATHTDGVLTISIPKLKTPANQARRVTVKQA
jgi:HSP20 family protein